MARERAPFVLCVQRTVRTVRRKVLARLPERERGSAQLRHQPLLNAANGSRSANSPPPQNALLRSRKVGCALRSRLQRVARPSGKRRSMHVDEKVGAGRAALPAALRLSSPFTLWPARKKGTENRTCSPHREGEGGFRPARQVRATHYRCSKAKKRNLPIRTRYFGGGACADLAPRSYDLGARASTLPSSPHPRPPSTMLLRALCALAACTSVALAEPDETDYTPIVRPCSSPPPPPHLDPARRAPELTHNLARAGRTARCAQPVPRRVPHWPRGQDARVDGPALLDDAPARLEGPLARGRAHLQLDGQFDRLCVPLLATGPSPPLSRALAPTTPTS